MTAALAHAPAHLVNKGRHELIRHAMNLRNTFIRHKETAKHAGLTVVGGLVASGGGALAGVLAVKAPHLPKTKIRTDLVIGTIIGGVCAAGVFDEHSPTVAAFSHGLLGYGTGDATKQMLLAKGVKQAA